MPAMSAKEAGSSFASHAGLVVRDDAHKGRCLFSERHFPVGTELFHENPYAAALYDEHVASRCHLTHEASSRLLR